EQQVSVLAIQRLEAELVDDQHAGAHELAAVTLAALVLLVAPQPVDELISGGEGHAETVLDGADAQALRQVGFADSGRTQEEHVLLALSELGGGQQVELVLVQAPLEAVVVLLKRLPEAEAAEFQGGLHAPFLAR